LIKLNSHLKQNKQFPGSHLNPEGKRLLPGVNARTISTDCV